MNSENLKPNSERTPLERKQLASKAGIASGKARLEKKMIQDALRKALSGKYEVPVDKEGNFELLGGYDAMAISMIKQAIIGDVKAFIAIRDSIGEKPTETITATVNTENQLLLNQYMESVKHGQIKNKEKKD